MSQWIGIVEKMGPFTAPLCIAMGLAIRWLLKQLNVMKQERDDVLKRERELLHERTADQVAATKALGDGALVQNETMRDLTTQISAALDAVRG